MLLPINKKSTHLLLNLSFRLGNVFKTISRLGERPKAHFPRKTIFYNAHQKWQKFACQAFILFNDNERALTRFQQISEMIKLKKKHFTPAVKQIINDTPLQISCEKKSNKHARGMFLFSLYFTSCRMSWQHSGWTKL